MTISEDLREALASLSLLDPVECCPSIEDETSLLAGRGMLRSAISATEKRDSAARDAADRLVCLLESIWDGGKDDEDGIWRRAMEDAKVMQEALNK